MRGPWRERGEVEDVCKAMTLLRLYGMTRVLKIFGKLPMPKGFAWENRDDLC